MKPSTDAYTFQNIYRIIEICRKEQYLEWPQYPWCQKRF